MPLAPLVGHPETRRRLARAVRRGRLPQVLLVTGPVGVGKQRLALWLAQLLVCERAALEPCGECRRCHLVDGLAYADLHWFVPLELPSRSGDADKQIEQAAGPAACSSVCSGQSQTSKDSRASSPPPDAPGVQALCQRRRDVASSTTVMVMGITSAL